MGFDYETEDLFFDQHDHLWVEFILSVAYTVLPGQYYFEVTYELYDDYWNTIDEVEFRFNVDVVERRNRHDHRQIRARREVADEEWDAGAETLLRIRGE
jgi:hypothetical protein